MKFLSFGIVLIALIGCISCNHTLVGEYVYNSYFYERKLVLMPDSSFRLVYRNGLYKDSIIGNWNYRNKKVVLNSLVTYKELTAKDTSIFCDTCYQGITFLVKNIVNNEVIWANIKSFKNGELFDETVCYYGVGHLKKSQIDSVYFDFLGYEKHTFYPRNKQNKTYHLIYLVNREDKNKVIENEKWKYKKGQIISPKGQILNKNPQLPHVQCH